jgi:hypothetical protein
MNDHPAQASVMLSHAATRQSTLCTNVKKRLLKAGLIHHGVDATTANEIPEMEEVLYKVVRV